MPSSFFDAVDDLPPMTYLPSVTQLLSASSYPHAPSNVRAGNGSTKQLYGGLVAADESSDDEDNPRPNKRSKSDNTDMSKDSERTQEAPKRQRGRPKVSTRDETAAERRRTQIRLAQRAYRNRKENTINELTQKVESLQTSVKTVNTGFARLRENLLNTGLIHANSAILQQVDDLMQKLSEALESPPSDADKTSDGDESDPQIQILGQDQTQHGVVVEHTAPVALQGQRHSLSLGPAVDVHSNLLGVGADHSMFDLAGQNLTEFQNYPALPTSYPTFTTSKTGPRQSRNIQTSPGFDMALTSIDRFPQKRSYTYSFQETTFARRLHRLTIERAFQKIMNPHVDPDWLLKTFRLTFNFSNKERIISTFKNILARGTDEPLENWRTPFIHVGGAGLHFPRRGANGQAVYPPNLLDPVRVAVPWRIPNTETIPTADTFEEVLESVGFGGDWFDPHDVEEYLKTKGIYADPQASFVVVDTNRLGGEAAVTITSDSSPTSMNSEHAFQTLNSIDTPEIFTDFNSGQNNALPSSSNLTEDWLGQQVAYTSNDFDIELPKHDAFEVAARETRLLTIEIERFLERLADDSVCLGRAPGYRKQHVDNALALAMQEAF